MGSVKKFLFAVVIAIAIVFPVHSEEVALKKDGGVYHIPIRINDVITLFFILDTGAAEVSVPADVVMTLVRSGTLGNEDFLPGRTYSLADGSTVQSPRFIIRSLKIGNRVLRNVPATVSDVEGHLLLGQSLLEKFGSYTLDNRRQVLILGSDETQKPPVKIQASKHRVNFPLYVRNSDLTEPEGAVQLFFKSVSEEDFKASWNSLSKYSQNRIIGMVAEETDISKDIIRQLFDNNHPSVQRGFWKSFRESSKIPTIEPFASYLQLSSHYDIAIVKVSVGQEEIKFEVYREGDRWKVGLIESIEEFKGLTNQKE